MPRWVGVSLVCSLMALRHVTCVSWEPWVSLKAQTRTVSLTSGCSASRYLVSEDSVVVIEADRGQRLPGRVTCKLKFKPKGHCSLLLQCDKFHMEEKRRDRCVKDFLLVNGRGKAKYCGQDTSLLQSHNHGLSLALTLRTTAAASQSVHCRVTCCTGDTQVSLARDTGRAPVQSCQTEGPGTETCGIPGTRIVGGQVAARHQYTWLAMLTRAGRGRDTANSLNITGIPRSHEPFCGGSLVAAHWVMTASHCTLPGEDGRMEPWKYRVVLGAWDREAEDSMVRVHGVTEQIRHPSYNAKTYDSDLALWRLDSPADLRVYSRICLPSPGLQLLNPMTVAGWGITQEGSFDLAAKLQELDVPVVSHSVCEAAMVPYPVTANMLCAGGIPRQDACQGDSGGPLMGIEPESNRTFLAGVVSWGIGCGRRGKFGVYTKVSRYRNWFLPKIAT